MSQRNMAHGSSLSLVMRPRLRPPADEQTDTPRASSAFTPWRGSYFSGRQASLPLTAPSPTRITRTDRGLQLPSRISRHILRHAHRQQAKPRWPFLSLQSIVAEAERHHQRGRGAGVQPSALLFRNKGLLIHRAECSTSKPIIGVECRLQTESGPVPASIRRVELIHSATSAAAGRCGEMMRGTE